MEARPKRITSRELEIFLSSSLWLGIKAELSEWIDAADMVLLNAEGVDIYRTQGRKGALKDILDLPQALLEDAIQWESRDRESLGENEDGEREF